MAELYTLLGSLKMGFVLCVVAVFFWRRAVVVPFWVSGCLLVDAIGSLKCLGAGGMVGQPEMDFALSTACLQAVRWQMVFATLNFVSGCLICRNQPRCLHNSLGKISLCNTSKGVSPFRLLCGFTV
ncbi:hypothetical protein, partial [Kingella sp. (in: b-proteobacteria)]|uniref:hypothetical protein n=1 Tax=Kingella sp. (in: b-proteobacteria) TaxID=2020713 RepID=UPI0026DB735E